MRPRPSAHRALPTVVRFPRVSPMLPAPVSVDFYIVPGYINCAIPILGFIGTVLGISQDGYARSTGCSRKCSRPVRDEGVKRMAVDLHALTRATAYVLWVGPLLFHAMSPGKSGRFSTTLPAWLNGQTAAIIGTVLAVGRNPGRLLLYASEPPFSVWVRTYWSRPNPAQRSRTSAGSIRPSNWLACCILWYEPLPVARVACVNARAMSRFGTDSRSRATGKALP